MSNPRYIKVINSTSVSDKIAEEHQKKVQKFLNKVSKDDKSVTSIHQTQSGYSMYNREVSITTSIYYL